MDYTITNHFKPSVWLRLLYDYICIKKRKCHRNKMFKLFVLLHAKKTEFGEKPKKN